MTEDQLAVNRNAITLQGGDLDLDLLLPDLNWYIFPGFPYLFCLFITK
jgi:cohesin complex subunit SCC1